MKNIIGKTLGPYQILLKVQETPSKAIYKAFDSRLGRTVALEIILPSTAKPEGLIAALKNHAKNLAKLSHPNIPVLLDCCEYKEELCLAFDFIPRGVFHRRFGQQMKWQEAARELIPVCQSLSYAHQNGIIHGNITQDNILINQEGIPFLFDFGVDLIIAQELLKDAPGKWIGLGISSFNAPELVIGKQIDQQSDIYSIGMVFYELVMGRKAFQGDSILEELAYQYSREIHLPKKRAKELPAPIKLILQKTLSKPPEDRFREIQQLTILFSKVALDIPVTLQDVKDPDASELERKHPFQWWIPASAFLILAAIVAVVITHQSSVDQLKNQNSPAASLASSPTHTPIPASTVSNEIPPADPTKIPASKEFISADFPALLGQPLPPASEIITPDNIQKLVLLGKWGIGKLNDTAWSKDGNLFAVASDQGIFILNSKTLQVIEHLDSGVPVQSVDFSTDSKSLASGEKSGLVQIWNLETGEEQKYLSGHLKAVNAVIFSPDSQLLASGSDDGTIRIWNVQSGEVFQELKKHSREVVDLDFSPDGSLLLSGSPDYSLKVWEIATGRIKIEISQPAMIYSVAFSADGKTVLAGGSNGVIELWDIENGSRIMGLRGLQNSVESISVSKDLGYVIGGDSSGNIIAWDSEGKALWKATNQRLPRIMGITFDYSNCIELSSENGVVSSAIWDGTIRYYNIQTGIEENLLDSISDYVDLITVSPHSRFLAGQTKDGMVKIWDLTSGTTLYKWPGSLVVGDLFSNDDRYIAVRTNTTTVTIYDLFTGDEVWTFNGNNNVRSIAFDNLLAVGNRNDVKIWSLSSGQEIKTKKSTDLGNCSYANNLAFANYSDLVGFSNGICSFKQVEWMKSLGYTINFASVAIGGESKLEFRGIDMKGLMGLLVKEIAVSPDGFLIAAFLNDQSLRIWDANTGNELTRLEGHNNSITALTFSPDGKLLISAALDGTIQIWGIY